MRYFYKYCNILYLCKTTENVTGGNERVYVESEDGKKEELEERGQGVNTKMGPVIGK